MRVNTGCVFAVLCYWELCLSSDSLQAPGISVSAHYELFSGLFMSGNVTESLPLLNMQQHTDACNGWRFQFNLLQKWAEIKTKRFYNTNAYAWRPGRAVTLWSTYCHCGPQSSSSYCNIQYIQYTAYWCTLKGAIIVNLLHLDRAILSVFPFSVLR